MQPQMDDITAFAYLFIVFALVFFLFLWWIKGALARIANALEKNNEPAGRPAPGRAAEPADAATGKP